MLYFKVNVFPKVITIQNTVPRMHAVVNARLKCIACCFSIPNAIIGAHNRDRLLVASDFATAKTI
jgi:hypothetical protein